MCQAGGTGGADQPQKPSRAGTQPTPRATPTPLFPRNNLPTPDADATRSEPQRTWLARHLVHPPAGASENTGRFQRSPSPRTPPHGRGGTCDRSRHTPLSARKSHPPQARPPNSGRPPRLRYPPRTHSPGGATCPRPPACPRSAGGLAGQADGRRGQNAYLRARGQLSHAEADAQQGARPVPAQGHR